MLTDSLKKILQILSDFAHSRQSEIWLVGGIVRDGLLGDKSFDGDLDLVLEGDIATFAPDFAALIKCKLTKYNRFLTVKLTELDSVADSLDLTAMRVETYLHPGALPTVAAGTFEQDCRRRDFTVNSLYISLADFLNKGISPDCIIDKTTGLSDLNLRLIRVMHEKSFIDDPTRLFRTLRYKIRIKGQLEGWTEVLFESAIKNGAINTISRQRVLNELKKACQVKEWKEVITAFVSSGLITDLIEAGQASRLAKMLEIKTSEPFDLLCAALYYLNPDQDKFRGYGFGKKFFKQAEEYRRYFEMI